jgi:aryl-alcohol dehydrogenase-like predicted oxidoreductase
LEKRKLGSSSLELSLVGLGTNNFGGRIDLEASRKVIHKALDLGITHFDTADVYGNRGGSEEIIGKVLGPRRKEVTIATKFGNAMGDDADSKGASPKYVARAIEASLKRLQTDWIDLYYLHRPDPATPIAETLHALDGLVKAGKVRHLAGSNFNETQADEAVATAGKASHTGFVAMQEEYSLLARGIEKAILPTLARLKLGLIPYFPLAGGSLSGKYRKGETLPTGTRHAAGSQRFLDPHWDTIEKLRAFAEKRGHTLLDLAMSWLAHRPQVASIIAGATKPEQLEANAKSVTWKMTAADLAEVDKITG